MPKLHELLAIHASQDNQLSALLTELKNTFTTKRHLFSAKTVTFTPSAEGAEAVTEEQGALQSTVRKELAWIGKFFCGALNTSHAIDVANTQARATLSLPNGDTIPDIPATTLLELEKRITAFGQLLAAIPTLDPAKAFEAAPDAGEGVYRSRDLAKVRTKKSQRALVLYPATDKHPAQTQLISEDEPVGHVRTVEFSSMLTPAEKAVLMERVEDLTRAVKAARARANETTAAVTPLGEALLSYLLG